MVYFSLWLVLDKVPDDQTSWLCTFAIGSFSCTTVLELNADPSGLGIGVCVIVLITLWSKIQPSILNNHKLAIWLLFLPHLREACVRSPVNGSWITNTLRNMFRGVAG